jgi:hypothetical protein
MSGSPGVGLGLAVAGCCQYMFHALIADENRFAAPHSPRMVFSIGEL